MIIQELITYGIQQLPNVTTARLDIEILLAHVLQCSNILLYSHPERVISKDLVEKFKELLTRRKNGEPIAYIIEEKQFWTFSVTVTKDVLIPRPDTETLVEQALIKIKQHTNGNNIQILDLGTGSGIIAIALALEMPNANIYAGDNSLAALTVAKANAVKNKINNILFYHGHWFEPLQHMRKQFHYIISNPPYIAIYDPCLANRELRFEPQEALVSGQSGLDAITIIISQGINFLVNGGWLFIEHGCEQQAAIQELFKKYNYCNICSYKDLSGHDRVTCGCTPAEG